MPRRNLVKVYGADQYYHCYNRGVDKQNIFRDEDDYGYFLSLFKRHLSLEQTRDKVRRPYPHYVHDVEVVAYCLMPNHYHLLLYNKNAQGIELLLRSVMTAYSRYFNLRYGRSGSLFESEFLASRITSDEYLWHVSRYIHLNPVDIEADHESYEYSSLRYFKGRSAEWIHPERLVSSTEESGRYLESVRDAREYRVLRNSLKSELASR